MKKRIESIPSHIMNKFKRWHWPGNIRELENFIERAVILTSGTVLNVPVSELSEAAPLTKIPETESERDQIIQVLKETKGRVGGPDGAAKRLAIKRTTLLARMKKFGINPHHWF
jgi:formate hydrogenlyase transcriptional activator